jgi:hypothetical protein
MRALFRNSDNTSPNLFLLKALIAVFATFVLPFAFFAPIAYIWPPDNTDWRALTVIGIVGFGEVASAFLSSKMMNYYIFSRKTLSDRQRIRHAMDFSIVNKIEIGVSALVTTCCFLAIVFMDKHALQNTELWRPLALFPSLWFANTYVCIAWSRLYLPDLSSLETFRTTNSNENRQPTENRSNSVTPQPSHSHTRRNQNRPQNDPQRSNDPTLPLLNPSATSVTPPITTYGSFSQPEPPLPAYESLLAPPPSYAETVFPFFRPPPVSLEDKEESQQSADGDSVPTPCAPSLSEEESQQSSDDDSVHIPCAPPLSEEESQESPDDESAPTPCASSLYTGMLFRPPPVSPAYKEESRQSSDTPFSI